MDCLKENEDRALHLTFPFVLFAILLPSVFPALGIQEMGFVFLIEVQLIYNVVLASSVEYSYSVIHMHIYLLSQLLFPYRLLQNFQYNSLFYTVGPCLFYI